MNRILISTGLAAVALLAIDHVQELQSRVAELERAPHVQPDFVRELSREIESLRADLAEAGELRESDDTIERIEGRLAVVASTLERERCRVEEQAAQLHHWESRWSTHAPETIDGRIEELSTGLAARQVELDELRNLNSQIAEQDQQRFDQLKSKVEPLLESRDRERMWHDLVGPVVQLAGDSTVGSGVLLESRPRANGQGWVTHLLTSWHVVRDIYGSSDRTSMPVPVRMYEMDGSTRDEHAHMVTYDVTLDLALLEMNFDAPVRHGARLASRSALANVRVFDPIYAVGCPLGNDPIPTVGEVAATTHVVDGQSYWMVSAPTYIGNSGGGIFDARTHELIGIFSKIYTHGATRSTIVPHMGLATPMPVVYEWLDHAGCTSLVEPRAGEVKSASAVIDAGH